MVKNTKFCRKSQKKIKIFKIFLKKNQKYPPTFEILVLILVEG